MSKAKIAVVNFETSGDKPANQEKMIDFITQAAEQGCDLIVFPEESLTGIGEKGVRGCQCGRQTDDMRQFRNSCPRASRPRCSWIWHVNMTCTSAGAWRDADPERDCVCHNASVLVGPEGLCG